MTAPAEPPTSLEIVRHLAQHEIDAVSQLVERATDQIGLPAQQLKQTPQFRALQRRTVPLIQIRHLLQLEILKAQPRAHIKWRLVDISDE